MDPTIERYVATKMIDRWMKAGYTKNDIPLLWNTGHAGACSAGVNSLGVHYDSCAYQRAVIARI